MITRAQLEMVRLLFFSSVLSSGGKIVARLTRTIIDACLESIWVMGWQLSFLKRNWS